MPPPATILVVDDQPSILVLLQHQLRTAGYAVVPAATAHEALRLLRQQPVDLVLSDLVMPDMDGLTLLARVREEFGPLPFVVITAHGTVASAVEALRQGAFDYVEKHCSPDQLLITIRRALAYQALVHENDQLRQEYARKFSFQNIVTVCPEMKRVLELAATVTGSPRTTVALIGESGAGKEVLARAIHVASGGRPATFVGVNCAAIPATLLESELFGHVRGSFTGADRDREGKIAAAKGGTLLLDEIGDMPLELQAKLLRVLEDRVFEPVGSNQSRAVDCRIIVATNHDLGALVAQGRFRADLFHRINVFPLIIPPLRDRREDIPILAEHFMNLLRGHLGKSLPGISRYAMDRLTGYSWPGNVRELRNCLERSAIIVPDGTMIRPEHLAITTPLTAAPAESAPPDRIDYRLSFSPDEFSLAAVTRHVLDLTLQRCGGNKVKAALLLKVNRKIFYR